MVSISRRLGAEFIGTFWLVLGGCGTAVLAAAFPQLGVAFVGVALALLAQPGETLALRAATVKTERGAMRWHGPCDLLVWG